MNVWLVNYYDGSIQYVTGVADSLELARTLAQRHTDAVQSAACSIDWHHAGVIGAVSVIGRENEGPIARYGIEQFEVSTD